LEKDLVKIEVKPVLALSERLKVTDIEVINEVLTITAVSTQVHPVCPLCGMPALREHSRYLRQVADLPCSGQQVRLLIQVRKYFCDAFDCIRKIFVEHLMPFVDTFARVTRRLYQIVQIIGRAPGGRVGVRVRDSSFFIG
jgi:transposase